MKKSLRAAVMSAALALALTIAGVVPAHAATATTGTVAVTVQAPGGTPLKDVWVSLSGAGWDSGSTDAQGKFTSTELAPGTYDVSAQLSWPVETTATQQVSVTANSNSAVTLTLTGVQAIKGSVKAKGASVSSGSVSAFTAENDSYNANIVNGTYLLLVKPGKTYTVQAYPTWTDTTKTWLPTYAGNTVRSVDAAKVKVSASAPSTANITAYDKVGKLTGRVVNSSGKGVKDVSVSAYALNRAGYAWATTDANGNYVLAGLPAGSYEVSAGNPTSGSGLAKAKVTTGGTAKATIKLKKSQTLKSKVILTLKAPKALIKKGDACATLFDSKGLWAGRGCLSGSSKTITFDSLAAGTYKVALDGANVSKKVTVKKSKTAKVSMTRAAGTTITGKITTSSGKALAKAWVYVTDANKTGLRGVQTNSKGTYKLSGPIKGKYVVSTYPAKNTQGAMTSKSVTMKGKKATVNVKLTKGASIVGKVVNSKGKPVAGVQITAQGGGDWASAVTDSKGMYKMIGLVKGKYSVTTYDPYMGGYLNGKATKSVTTGKKATVSTIKLKG